MVEINFETGSMKLNEDRIMDLGVTNFRRVLKLAVKYWWLNDVEEIKRQILTSLDRRTEEVQREWRETVEYLDHLKDDPKRIAKKRGEAASRADHRCKRILKYKQIIEEA